MLRRSLSTMARLALVLALAAAVIAGTSVFAMVIRSSNPTVIPLHDVVDAISDIHGLVIDPSNASMLWAPTHQGLARFTPAGGWEIVGEVGRDTMGLNIDPGNPRVMYASAHPSLAEAIAGKPRVSGFLVSRDRGRSWKTVSLEEQVDFHILSMSPSDPKVFYMSGIYVDREERPALLYVSRDRGQTWEAIETGLPRVLALGVDPRDPDSLLAGTEAGLWVSSDSGGTWGSLSSDFDGVPISAVAYSQAGAQIWAYASTPRLGLVLSADGGLTWDPTGQYLGADDRIEIVAPHPTNSAVVFVSTQAVDVYRSDDGGSTLEPLMQRGQAVH